MLGILKFALVEPSRYFDWELPAAEEFLDGRPLATLEHKRVLWGWLWLKSKTIDEDVLLLGYHA